MKRAILFLSLLLIACNRTSTSNNGQVQDSRIIEPDSRKLLQLAAEGSMTELATGRFASGHATDQRLKSYGFQMIKDHEQLLGEIKRMVLLQI
ncbi:MAG: DUF4142 domain-containing protein [Taibaiella sp.]|jgi:predicted outer membrane protein